MNKVVINGVEMVELPAAGCTEEGANCHFNNNKTHAKNGTPFGRCPRTDGYEMRCTANRATPILYIKEEDLLDLRLRGLA